MNARIVASILKRIAKEIFTFDMTEENGRNIIKNILELKNGIIISFMSLKGVE